MGGFYLSPNADPYDELLANLKEANEKEDYQCRFPFRTKLFTRAGFWKPRTLTCPGHITWKGVFSKEKLYLAFAAQYMSNPASVFGHTFFILSPDRTKSTPHPEFLDLTLSYAAEMPRNTNGYNYVVKGLSGGFKGHFYDDPLYKRIYEYSNMELRDLWVYPINISEEKIDDLLDYVWELGLHPYFGYYFLDENCSYMLMEILDVINPEGHLTKDFPIWVLPVETIKSLQRQHRLGAGFVIPSMRRKFLKEYDRLSGQEKSQLKKAISGDLESLKTKEATDVMITYMDKKKIEKKGVSSLEEQKQFQKLLIKRSGLGPKVDDDKKYIVLDPIKSHEPYALSLKTGTVNGHGFQEIEFRPIVHDLLDLNAGFIEHSQIKLGTPTLRLDDRGGVRLQQFQLATAANIVPFRMIDPIYSWKINIERTHLQDKLCFDCSVTRVALGIGYTVDLGDHLNYYFIPGVNADWGRDVRHHFRGGPGIFSGFIFDFTEKFKLNPSFDYFYADKWLRTSQTVFKPGIDGSINFSRSFSLRGTYREWRTYPVTIPSREVSGSMVYFF